MRNKNEYPECITDVIELDDLNNHPDEAETTPDKVINSKEPKLFIFADYQTLTKSFKSFWF